MRSVFSELMKLSIAKLSQTSPARLNDQADALLLEQPLEVLAGVLAALVRVRRQHYRLAPRSLHCHQQLDRYELRSHALLC